MKKVSILFLLVLFSLSSFAESCRRADSRTGGAARALIKQLAGINNQTPSVWVQDEVGSSDDDLLGTSSGSDDDLFGGSSDNDLLGSDSDELTRIKFSSVTFSNGRLKIDSVAYDISDVFVKVRGGKGTTRYANVAMLVGCTEVDDRSLIIKE